MKTSKRQRLQFLYYGLVLDYAFTPGKWMSDQELSALKRDLEATNCLANRPLNYGLFDPNRDSPEKIRDFFTSVNLCRMIQDHQTIGYFYHVELEDKKLSAVHMGLVVIAKNPGVDLLVFPYLIAVLLYFLRRGTYYVTEISGTPSIIGSFGEFAVACWPSHRATSAARPPEKRYVQVLEMLETQYIRKYFPADSLTIDKRRFVMSSPVEEMGFEPDMRRRSRHPDLLANLFCQLWLDPMKGEDLIQVGKITGWLALKIMVLIAISWARGILKLCPETAQLITFRKSEKERKAA